MRDLVNWDEVAEKIDDPARIVNEIFTGKDGKRPETRYDISDAISHVFALTQVTYIFMHCVDFWGNLDAFHPNRYSR